MPTITNVVDPVRGCGKRNPGGLYLISGAGYRSCCGLPVPLTVCPCCGQGIKFFRGFGWIEPRKLFAGVYDPEGCPEQSNFCVLSNLPETMGLMWVGNKFYSPDQFTNEAAAFGISKRIATIPRGLVVGQTWIALAHTKAIKNLIPVPAPGLDPVEFTAGVFMFFKPARIEYVVTGSETVAELEDLEKRGVSLVRVTGHLGEQQTIFET